MIPRAGLRISSSVPATDVEFSCPRASRNKFVSTSFCRKNLEAKF